MGIRKGIGPVLGTNRRLPNGTHNHKPGEIDIVS